MKEVNKFKRDLEWIAQTGRMGDARRAFEKWKDHIREKGDKHE